MTDLFKKPGQVKQLRPHQVRAIEMLRSSLGKGNRRVVIQGPTGFGKTLVAAKIIERALGKGNRVIFTAPAVSLIDQTVAAFEAEGIEDIGVMQANHPRTNKDAAVQVASVQTLSRRQIPDAALMLVDECHMQFKAINDLLDKRKDVFFAGLSATPWARGMGLRWQDLVIPTTISELIDDGYLSRFSVYGPDVPDLSKVRSIGGDYAEDALEQVMGEAKLVGNVVENWLAHGENRPTLCFAVNRAHAALLHKEFSRAGVASAYVDGFTDRVEREYLGAKFREREIPVIVSVRTMTTGVDLPVSCLIDAAPKKSEMLHVQTIGRGLRVNDGTEDCVIFDHAGNSLRLGLVTDIHHDKLDATKPGEKREAVAGADKLPKPCSKCGVIASGLVCTNCGHERQRIGDVETAEGRLVQITGKKVVPTKAEKQRFWSMALWLDGERCKAGKFALAMHRARFGEWPRGLDDIKAPPDQAFLSYERSRRIAFAKSKSKRRAA
ncbi:DEAD/DEAH box helicase [Stappia indica]|uniref:DEAD/DEAH box helicase n=1 Tax=Stappia indica TaxID=538381 RepID=UPI001CD642A3|nr:DEAD/DEAH box helicase [Stappia indica]MCA1298020.1 DEAD/DEAH box helicase [Stappia indica]